MIKENQLQVLLNEQGLEQDKSQAIVEAFGGPFDEAGEVLANYRDLEVTDESQVDLMKQAREKRLILKKARTTVETSRKALKEDIVKQGRAIDSVARFVKETIQPAEEWLEQQEKFAEVKEAERAAVLKAERVEQLSKYNDNLSIYNLDTMTEETFHTLFSELKQAHEAKIAAERKIEEERLATEKAAAEEQERIRKENERLKAEAVEREARLAEERETEAKKRAEERAEQDKILAAERAKSEEERKKREALEIERKVAEEAEAKRKANAEDEERKALLAPDKEKLLAFSAALEVIRTQKLPAVKTKQAQDVVNQIDEMLAKMQTIITTKAKGL